MFYLPGLPPSTIWSVLAATGTPLPVLPTESDPDTMAGRVAVSDLSLSCLAISSPVDKRRNLPYSQKIVHVLVSSPPASWLSTIDKSRPRTMAEGKFRGRNLRKIQVVVVEEKEETCSTAKGCYHQPGAE